MDSLLDSEQAARLLGVKRSTLYVYVSRGYLKPHRQADAHRSLFALDDVQRLAERSSRQPSASRLLPPLATSITTVTPTGLAYRGVQAAALAETFTFEQVAELLWQVPAAAWEPTEIDVSQCSTNAEIVRAVVTRFTSSDPTSTDRCPSAVAAVARRLITTAATALTRDDAAIGGDPAIASMLCSGVGLQAVNPLHVRSIDAVMILLADHDFAPSTLAVRIASNVGSTLSNAILAGLGVLSGPLHDGSERAFDLIEDAARTSPERALRRCLEDGDEPPGFDRIRQDPRARLIGSYVRRCATREQWSLYSSLLRAASQLGLPLPGIDVALGALMWTLGARSDAGSTLFAVSRIAGWTAHYLEEVLEPPRRFHFHPVHVSQLGESSDHQEL